MTVFFVYLYRRLYPYIIFSSLRRFAIIVILSLSSIFTGYAQSSTDEDNFVDEISVKLEVKGIGSKEIPAAYRDDEIFLSITSVFDFIKIRNIPNDNRDSIFGFFINEQNVYLIDVPNNRIVYKGVETKFKDDGFIPTETDLYLNLKYIKSIFGFEGAFQFRRLVVTLSSNEELPAIKEERQALMRKNVRKLNGENDVDTVVERQHPFFHFGTADWALMTSDQSPGGNQTSVNLGLGSELAGGELNTSFNYYSQQGFNEKLQFYQWRFVDNDAKAVRQVAAGKIFTQSTATLYAPVVGVQVTNASTLYRKSYGSYTLTNTTEPGWTIELYVNDVLVDYKKADAGGFYSFEVPLVYGFTIVKLKFYGPYGEVRTSQQYINIPFNFLPKNEFEYSINAGIVEDGKDSKFTRASMKYGISRNITVGGGTEYLSSVTSGSFMPYVNSSVRLAPRMLFTGEYTHNVRFRGILSSRYRSGFQYELDYVKYKKGQTAIFYNYLEDRKAIISMPFHSKKFSMFSRLTVNNIILPNTQYTNTELSFTGFVGRVGVNLSSYMSFARSTVPYLYSVASATVPLPAKSMLTAQLQYDHKTNIPIFSKLTIEKRIFKKGYASFAYQEYYNVKNRNFLLGMRYDLSFARAAVSLLAGSNKTYSRIAAASGSMVFDHKSGYASANNRTNVGKGGIVFKPFLDVNSNGLQDAGEPIVWGLKARVNGGRVVYDEKDSLIRILDLEPYNKYFVELKESGFDNISWKIRNKKLNIVASPNNFVLISVPVAVAGEVSGSVGVLRDGKKEPEGLGQVIVCIFDSTMKNLVARTVSESDGYFSYLGLRPGKYIVTVDSAQISKIHMTLAKRKFPVTIHETVDGDMADWIDFVLIPESKEEK